MSVRKALRPVLEPVRRLALVTVLLWLPAAWLPGTAAAALPALELAAPVTSTDVIPHVLHRCEAGTPRAPDALAAADFAPLPGGSPTFGYRTDTCWFRFALRNADPQPLALVLSVDYALIDHLQLHWRDAAGHWQQQRSGDAEPWAVRPLDTHMHLFTLQLPPAATQEYLLAFSSMNSMYVPLRVAGPGEFIAAQLPSELLIGLFYGIAAGLALYNLLLWVSLRERAYLYYVAYVSLTVLVFAGWQGTLYPLWPDSPRFNNALHQNVVLGSMLASVLLLREFLATRDWPRVDRLALALVGGIVLCLLAQLVLPLGWITRVQGVVAVVTVVLCLGIGIARWQQGVPAARLYVLAWLVFVVAVAWVVLATYNVTHWGIHLVEGMQAAMLLQQVLLSLGLAERINALKQDKLEHERAVLHMQAEAAAKGDFLARMSHEIRTPLNAVIGIAQLLRDAPPADVQRGYVDALNSAGQGLLNLVNDILDYSRVSAGKLALEQADFDLQALLDQCVAIFALSARQKSLALQVERAHDVPRWVRGDATRLRQVLLNLLGNALKFTDRGTVWLRVLRQGDSDHVVLVFEVEDTGIGIPAEQQARLFQSFEQGDTSTSRVYGGSGLGLAICRQLVELMGGHISVRSEPGRGSCFRFTVALEHGEPPAEVAATPLVVDGLAGLRVLVAEDNPVNQLVADGMLRRLGIKARLVNNGEEAVRAVTEAAVPFDLLLMDCEMPRMDGFAAARHIRELEQKRGGARLPIVAMTAHALAESRERCIAAGMDDHLGKPLTLELLAGKLRSWSGRSHAP